MRIVANCGNRVHAPQNTRLALASAYVAGAGALRVPVRLTADKRAVVAEDDDVSALTGVGGKISALTLAAVRALNFAATFKDAAARPFKFPASKIETFGLLLDVLPTEPDLVVELLPDSDAERRRSLVAQVLSAAANRGMAARLVVCSADADALREVRKTSPATRTAAINPDAPAAPDAQPDAAVAAGADGVVLPADAVLDGATGARPTLTAAGKKLVALGAAGELKLGAILSGADGLSPQAYSLLAGSDAFWGATVDSVLAAAPAFRPGWLWIDEKWDHSAEAHEDVNADLWHLGYAKYNPERYCHVYPDRGVHIDIKPFAGTVDFPPTGDAVREGMHHLLERTWDSIKDWPFYSGGGVGFNLGIEGAFSAEIDVRSEAARQATTVEMAAVNVDPATHRKPWVQDAAGKWNPNYPTSFRDKHTFFDPHGAPPFVGVEHDEDDGWRINWNLGTDYDSNQYGKPCGDGKALAGRMRLDRRGDWFAAYFRAPDGVGGWLCVGVARNQSLNSKVFLRLAGKRWRQENPDKPSEWMPVIPNRFTFQNMTITRYPAAAGAASE